MRWWVAIAFGLIGCLDARVFAQGAEREFKLAGSFGEAVVLSVESGGRFYVAQGPKLVVMGREESGGWTSDWKALRTFAFDEPITDLHIEENAVYVATSAPGRCAVHLVDLTWQANPRVVKNIVKGSVGNDGDEKFELMKFCVWC